MALSCTYPQLPKRLFSSRSVIRGRGRAVFTLCMRCCSWRSLLLVGGVAPLSRAAGPPPAPKACQCGFRV